jgi:hypothetical protein
MDQRQQALPQYLQPFPPHTLHTGQVQYSRTLTRITVSRLVDQDGMPVHMLPQIPITIGRMYQPQNPLSTGWCVSWLPVSLMM